MFSSQTAIIVKLIVVLLYTHRVRTRYLVLCDTISYVIYMFMYILLTVLYSGTRNQTSPVLPLFYHNYLDPNV